VIADETARDKARAVDLIIIQSTIKVPPRVHPKLTSLLSFGSDRMAEAPFHISVRVPALLSHLRTDDVEVRASHHLVLALLGVHVAFQRLLYVEQFVRGSDDMLCVPTLTAVPRTTAAIAHELREIESGLLCATARFNAVSPPGFFTHTVHGALFHLVDIVRCWGSLRCSDGAASERVLRVLCSNTSNINPRRRVAQMAMTPITASAAVEGIVCALTTRGVPSLGPNLSAPIPVVVTPRKSWRELSQPAHRCISHWEWQARECSRPVRAAAATTAATATTPTTKTGTDSFVGAGHLSDVFTVAALERALNDPVLRMSDTEALEFFADARSQARAGARPVPRAEPHRVFKRLKVADDFSSLEYKCSESQNSCKVFVDHFGRLDVGGEDNFFTTAAVDAARLTSASAFVDAASTYGRVRGDRDPIAVLSVLSYVVLHAQHPDDLPVHRSRITELRTRKGRYVSEPLAICRRAVFEPASLLVPSHIRAERVQTDARAPPRYLRPVLHPLVQGEEIEDSSLVVCFVKRLSLHAIIAPFNERLKQYSGVPVARCVSGQTFSHLALYACPLDSTKMADSAEAE
jgi:hypothetical protein